MHAAKKRAPFIYCSVKSMKLQTNMSYDFVYMFTYVCGCMDKHKGDENSVSLVSMVTSEEGR